MIRVFSVPRMILNVDEPKSYASSEFLSHKHDADQGRDLKHTFNDILAVMGGFTLLIAIVCSFV